MSRKIQQEIEKTLKKVTEGIESFDETWIQMERANTANQKEKLEAELKKKIKKLQQLRDTVKTWIAGTEIKDKNQLLEARRAIELEMERFKACEKEAKTKAYSKEGLGKKGKKDPKEEEKEKQSKWISEALSTISDKMNEMEVEMEALGAASGAVKKGKGKSNPRLEVLSKMQENHKFHMEKLEMVLRMMTNDDVGPELVEAVKDDVDYYLEKFEDPDYEVDLAIYDEIFEAAGTAAAIVAADLHQHDNSDSDSSSSSEEEKNSPIQPALLPPAVVQKQEQKKATGGPAKPEPKPEVKPTPTPTPTTTSSVATSSLSTSTSSVATSSVATSSVAVMGGGGGNGRVKAADVVAGVRHVHDAAFPPLNPNNPTPPMPAMNPNAGNPALSSPGLTQADLLKQSLYNNNNNNSSNNNSSNNNSSMASRNQPQPQQQQQQQQPQQHHVTAAAVVAGHEQDQTGSPVIEAVSGMDRLNQLSLLQASYLSVPEPIEAERKPVNPSNPYPVPPSYPMVPSPVFENPALFDRFDTDTLFFIFYFQQGTYQQYLAAKELKKQSWRYHKKYLTWFQRHEEPKVTTDDYEQGTYVYFDFESGWTQRIKSEFSFEYSWLEDELTID